MPSAVNSRRPIVEDAATIRARNAAQNPGEFSFDDTFDYVTLAGRLLRQSAMKYSHVARATSMAPSTASNLASGKTRYPRFSTITSVLGVLGYETVFRAGPDATPPPPTTGRTKRR